MSITTKDIPPRLITIALLVCATNLAPLLINFLYVNIILPAGLTEKFILSVSYIVNFVVIAWLTMLFCQKRRWAMYGVILIQCVTCINYLLLLFHSLAIDEVDRLTDKPFLTALLLVVTGFNLYLLLSPASHRLFQVKTKPHIRAFLLAIRRLPALDQPEYRPAETDKA
tara:strand:- start:5925 stop:6431 length:507 start_codon:yes stop_codon:yes gene_type:complete